MPIWIVLARQTSVVGLQWKLLQRDTSAPQGPRSAECVPQPPQAIPGTRFVGTARTCVLAHKSGTMVTPPAFTSPSTARQGKALPLFKKPGTHRSLTTVQSTIRPNARALATLINENTGIMIATIRAVEFLNGLCITVGFRRTVGFERCEEAAHLSARRSGPYGYKHVVDH